MNLKTRRLIILAAIVAGIFAWTAHHVDTKPQLVETSQQAPTAWQSYLNKCFQAMWHPVNANPRNERREQMYQESIVNLCREMWRIETNPNRCILQESGAVLCNQVESKRLTGR